MRASNNMGNKAGNKRGGNVKRGMGRLTLSGEDEAEYTAPGLPRALRPHSALKHLLNDGFQDTAHFIGFHVGVTNGANL